MELREISQERFHALRSRPESWDAEVSDEHLDEVSHEVERILLLRSASMELHRVLSGS